MTLVEKNSDKKEKIQINTASWSGLISGSFLFFVFYYRALCTVGIRNKICWLFVFVGAFLFMLGGLYPYPLIKINRLLRKAGEFTAKLFLRILILPVYIVNLLFYHVLKKRRNQLFLSHSRFVLAEPVYLSHSAAEYKTGKISVFNVLNGVLLFFSRNKLSFLIPSIIILLIIGLLFFFIPVHSLFPFIYTLF